MQLPDDAGDFRVVQQWPLPYKMTASSANITKPLSKHNFLLDLRGKSHEVSSHLITARSTSHPPQILQRPHKALRSRLTHPHENYPLPWPNTGSNPITVYKTTRERIRELERQIVCHHI